MNKQEDLFTSKLTPGKPSIGKLFEEKIIDNKEPVVCLGMEFKNDEARRTYFTEELRKELQNPEFRKIEGFPIGKDEDILKVSDPPYYTACPNPWIADFIEEWESQKPEKPADYHYHREPFATDVSEGKNDPLYRIPSYHTKVPPKAIERYLLHYTEPGDIVVDAFCGTGMTGVACLQLGKDVKKPNYGTRHAILFDLSPAAAFTASIMNSPLMPELNDGEKGELAKFIKAEILPLYETEFNGVKTSFDYAIWSDWGLCPNCGASFRLYDVVVDYKNQKMLAEYPCPECGTTIKSRDQKKAFTSFYDEWIGEIVEIAKTSMVLISNRKGNRAYRGDVTEFDTTKNEQVSKNPVSYSPKKLEYTHMTHERNNLPLYWGINFIHQFYSRRNYIALDKVVNINNEKNRKLALFCVLTILENNATRRNRFYVDKRRPKGSPVGPLSNTLYVPTLQVETNIGKKILGTISNIIKCKRQWHNTHSIVSNQSATSLLQLQENSVDFIFTDPPFGGNINYSEQNVLAEWWLKVSTNNQKEAITNSVQNKGVNEYQELMTQCFKEYYRVLKPGRWMVVEFHNSSNTIWTAIQQALEVAGFVVSTVDVLDKVHSTLHQDHNAAAVDKDLAITVYKPGVEFERQFNLDQGTDAGVWDFIKHHLGQLPVFIKKEGIAVVVAERQNYLLFDRMVAFHVQRGMTFPISSAEFYEGLSQRYSERDRMFFLPEQVAEYDKKRMTVEKVQQLSLFVSDEATAIQWLRQSLREKPQSYQDIYPSFIQETQRAWNKNEVGLELSTLLEQNFLPYVGKGLVPEQIHSYLSTNWKDMRNLAKDDPALIAKARGRWYVPDPNKAGDLEKLREKALLKEFEEYKQAKKKLKIFRLEAVRTGFKKAWQERDYQTIITVAEKIPNNILEEDPKLLMWFDQAITRMEE